MYYRGWNALKHITVSSGLFGYDPVCQHGYLIVSYFRETTFDREFLLRGALLVFKLSSREGSDKRHMTRQHSEFSHFAGSHDFFYRIVNDKPCRCYYLKMNFSQFVISSNSKTAPINRGFGEFREARMVRNSPVFKIQLRNDLFCFFVHLFQVSDHVECLLGHVVHVAVYNLFKRFNRVFDRYVFTRRAGKLLRDVERL